MRARLPSNEAARLAALEALEILDTPPSEALDDLALVASELFGTPISLVSLVDADRQWFKAKVGVEATETHRDLAFCAHAILEPDELLVVENTLEDVRFVDNDLVTGEPFIRFYAGAPLVSSDGLALGTLCVIDQKPRSPTAGQLEALRALSRRVVHEMERRVNVKRLRALQEASAQPWSDLAEQSLLTIARGVSSRTGDEFFRQLVRHLSSALDAPAAYVSELHPQRPGWARMVAASGSDVEGREYCLADTPGQRLAVDCDAVTIDSGLEAVYPQDRDADGFEAFSGAALFDSRGRPMGIMAVLFDRPLTTPRVTESMLQIFASRAAAELERRRVERELVMAKEAAESADRAKTDFLAAMSHEIRTPMNAVLGFAELLADTPLETRQREYVETIRLSGANLLEIIDDILDLSKIEAGRFDVLRVPFDVAGGARDVVQLFVAQAKDKDLALDLNVSDPPPTAVGDPGRFRQVLTNLLGNAVKFTDEGRVRVTVRAQSGGWVEVSVSDTGQGIAHDDVERLFDAFVQGDGSPSRRHGGVGLGLAISKRLVALMDGEIGYEPASGGGSRFWFRLPTTDERSEPLSPEGAVPEVGGEPSARTASVLVVEDNEVNQRLASAMLERLGSTVEVAASGTEALTKTDARHFDLIFMDCHMDGMDGLEATRRLRRRESDAGSERTPIVALSASALENERKACLAAGMDDFVAKPIQLSELSRVLRRWVST